MRTTSEIIDANRREEDRRFEMIAAENASGLALETQARAEREQREKDKLLSDREKARKFLENSGLIRELEEYKTKYITSKHQKFELFTDFINDLHYTMTTVVWGKAFRVEELPGGRHVIKHAGGINPQLDASYFTVELYPNTRRVAVCVPVDSGHYHRVHKEWGNMYRSHIITQETKSAIAAAFIAPGKVLGSGH